MTSAGVRSTREGAARSLAEPGSAPTARTGPCGGRRARTAVRRQAPAGSRRRSGRPPPASARPAGQLDVALHHFVQRLAPVVGHQESCRGGPARASRAQKRGSVQRRPNGHQPRRVRPGGVAVGRDGAGGRGGGGGCAGGLRRSQVLFTMRPAGYAVWALVKDVDSSELMIFKPWRAERLRQTVAGERLLCSFQSADRSAGGLRCHGEAYDPLQPSPGRDRTRPISPLRRQHAVTSAARFPLV